MHPIFFGCRVIGLVSVGVGLVDVECGGERISGYFCYKTNTQASKQNIYSKKKKLQITNVGEHDYAT